MEIVNDEFWLGYAKQGVTESITKLNEGAAALEKMVSWFWGAYTLAFSLGVTINLIKAPLWLIVTLSSPVMLLIGTYWLCVWAQMPVDTNYDPRIPDEIKLAYKHTFKTKRKRIKLALFGTILSAAILAFAISALSFVNK